MIHQNVSRDHGNVTRKMHNACFPQLLRVIPVPFLSSVKKLITKPHINRLGNLIKTIVLGITTCCRKAVPFLQCFDTIRWATGGASGLYKLLQKLLDIHAVY